MSKRQEEKEELARRLDAGQISQADYDERMARMKRRGKGAAATNRAVHRAKVMARTNAQEWRPRAE